MEFDLEQARCIVVAKLPLRSRWLVRNVPLDYDFTLAHRGHAVSASHAHAHFEWPGFWAFGQYDYAQCGGIHPRLGVRQKDGAVCVLDWEREKNIAPLNASIDQFIQSFDFLEECLMNGGCLPQSAKAHLEKIDSQTYPHSRWKALVEHLM